MCSILNLISIEVDFRNKEKIPYGKLTLEKIGENSNRNFESGRDQKRAVLFAPEGEISANPQR